MRYMEESLDVHLSNVLQTMQERILYHTFYFGVSTRKNPLDFWVYQEMIFDLKPDVIVEIGTFCGGSALAFAHLCDCLGLGRVISIEKTRMNMVVDAVKKHPRIILIEGDACQEIAQVKELINDGDTVLVVEDSSHHFDNTLNGNFATR